MEYNAKTQRGVLGFLLVITVASTLRYFIGDIVFDVIFYLQILLALFLFLSIFIRFKFVIDDGCLTFQTLFFSIPIYKKALFPNQINQIKFKRELVGLPNVQLYKPKKGLMFELLILLPVTCL